MKKELTFITVMGRDQKGIVAKIANLLYKNDINIEDVNQKVIEGVFVMTMLINMAGYKYPIKRLGAKLDRIAQEMNLKIQIQHENIFKMMHRI